MKKDKLTWHDLALEVTSEVKRKIDSQIRTQRPKIAYDIHISHLNDEKRQIDLTWPDMTLPWRSSSRSQVILMGKFEISDPKLPCS